MSFTLKRNQIWLDDRMLGWITTTMDGKKVFVSPRNRQHHYFRKHGGFGLSEDVLEFLRRNLFDEVHLRIGKRETLISKLSYWNIYGIKYHKKPEFEPQIILPEKHMKKKMLSLSEVME
ncbi:hypothetical protein ES702_02209 [subsurface metagenome]